MQTYISDTWLIKRARYLFKYSQNTTLKSLVDQPDHISLDTIIHAYKLGDRYIYNQVNLGLQLLAVSIANSLILQDAHKIYVNSELLNHDNFSAKLIHSVESQLAFIPTKRDINIEILKKDYYRGARGACPLVALGFIVQHSGYEQYRF